MTDLAPYLDKLSAAAWTAFINDYEVYRARGGVKRVRSLVSPSALRTLQLRVKLTASPGAAAEGAAAAPKRKPDDVAAAESAEDDRFIGAVNGFFAPRSPMEALDRFRSVKMSTSEVSIDAVMAYIQDYDRTEQACSAMRPRSGEKKLVALSLPGYVPSA